MSTKLAMCAGFQRSSMDTKPIAALLVMLFVVTAQAFVDYHCVFDDILSQAGLNGEPMYYCLTGMNPPAMKEGGFIWATRDDQCYECICEHYIGLACCECPDYLG